MNKENSRQTCTFFDAEACTLTYVVYEAPGSVQP